MRRERAKMRERTAGREIGSVKRDESTARREVGNDGDMVDQQDEIDRSAYP